MARNLYVIGTEPDCGKTVVTLGLMEKLLTRLDHVGFFRPLINVPPASKKLDKDVHLVLSHFNLSIPHEEAFGYLADVADTMSSLGKTEELIEGIMAKYHRLADSCSTVLCEGVDVGCLSGISEYELNMTLCRNLGCAAVAVISAFEKSSDEVLATIERVSDSLREQDCEVIGVFVNRSTEQQAKALRSAINLHERLNDRLFHFLPNDISLRHPPLAQIVEELGATVLAGESHLSRHVRGIAVGASHVTHLIEQIDHGTLVVTPGDRVDVLLGTIASAYSSCSGSVSGIVLTDGIAPGGAVKELLDGLDGAVPVLCVKQGLPGVTMALERMRAAISPQDERKIHSAMALFDSHVDLSGLVDEVANGAPPRMTPKMFEYQLIHRAQQEECHIVLPEGEDERILRAADILTRRGVARITLLGNEETVQKNLSALGYQLPRVTIVDPIDSDKSKTYAQELYELRKHKGVTLEQARDALADATYFGTMMVAAGDADGMVSGATHSTADTIRPALQAIRTDPNRTIVSSVFFMGMRDRVLVYGDCAVNPDPSADQLAQIAISSAATARAFGIEPVVAMLSYSSGSSGSGSDVDKVREATAIAAGLAKKSCPGLLIDGPMQYDAAVDPSVAALKMPESTVAGKANVLVFPDLNTGNNTYKAVQRSAGATAIGPVLQGLRRPVNDLSRGCSVRDVVTLVAITAIQAISA